MTKNKFVSLKESLLAVSSLLPLHGELIGMFSQTAHSKLTVSIANSEEKSDISGGSRIFEKGGRGNGKVTLGLLRLNINV